MLLLKVWLETPPQVFIPISMAWQKSTNRNKGIRWLCNSITDQSIENQIIIDKNKLTRMNNAENSHGKPILSSTINII
jgi:hypothetical protein